VLAIEVRQHFVKCMADIAYIQNEIVFIAIKRPPNPQSRFIKKYTTSKRDETQTQLHGQYYLREIAVYDDSGGRSKQNNDQMSNNNIKKRPKRTERVPIVVDTPSKNHKKITCLSTLTNKHHLPQPPPPPLPLPRAKPGQLRSRSQSMRSRSAEGPRGMN
jgi:hypothetical protein